MFDPDLEYVTMARKPEPKPKKYGSGWLVLFFVVGFVLGQGARLIGCW